MLKTPLPAHFFSMIIFAPMKAGTPVVQEMAWRSYRFKAYHSAARIPSSAELTMPPA